MASPKSRHNCRECGAQPPTGQLHSRQGLCEACALENMVGSWAQARRSPEGQWLELVRRRLRKIDAYFGTDFLIQFEQDMLRPLSQRSARRHRRYVVRKAIESGSPLARISDAR